VKYLSPLRIIQIAIADAIQCGFALEIEPDHIQIEIGYPKYDAHYSSSISLAIAHRQNAEPLAIAQEIAQICSQNLNISTQCQIEAVGKGWLNIKLNDQYLVKSLLNLDQLPIEGIEYDHGFWQKPTLSIFSAEQILEPTIEYAYARCCALMRLAYRDDPKFSQGLFTFQEYIEPTEISLLIENLAIAPVWF
jgi:arginyl-tRNA synthetase